MKNTRTSAVVALAIAGSLALTACTPPHENNSDVEGYLDTATTGPATPSIATTKSAEADSTETGAATETTHSNSTNSTTATPAPHEGAEQEPVGVSETAVEPAQGAVAQ